MIDRDVLYHKIYGSICGLAIGDCMGMPTEFMTPEEIQEKYGYVDKLVTPCNHIHKDLKYGMITDDTEITLQIIEEIIKNQKFDLEVAVEAIINWAKHKDVFNKSYLGPSSAKAIKALLKGVPPEEAGEYGATIGAAMRVTPLGLINIGNIQKAIADAEIMSIPTHNTNLAIAGATSIAAAIAIAMEEDSTEDQVLAAALYGAKEGEKRGNLLIGPSLHKRIELAIELVDKVDDLSKCASILYDYIGAGLQTYEVVPVVIALFYKSKGNVMKAIEASVNLGGDTDTIGAMVGALAGAFYGPGKLNSSIIEEIASINNIDFKVVATNLTEFILLRNNICQK